MIADRTYLVGLDGSDLSWEALRLATRIMGPKDDVHALAILKPGGAPDSLVPDESAVAEALNVAWAAHEIASDPMAQTLQWLREVMPPVGAQPHSPPARAAGSVGASELRE